MKGDSSMRQKSHYLSFILSALLVLVTIGSVLYFGLLHLRKAIQEDIGPLAISTVLIESGTEVGSAVHIGNGFFLTANHVLGQRQSEIVLVTNLGQTFLSDVLWTSADYDVALLHAPNINDVDIDRHILVCDSLSIGDDLMFVGNPMSLRFIHTWGKVASISMSVENMWKKVTPVNAVIIPGMSGGAVIDTNGFLRGINVGTMVGPTAMTMFGPTLSFTGISHIVEGRELCLLLGLHHR
jgi:serine protease Do